MESRPIWSATTSGVGSGSEQQTMSSSASGSSNPSEWCLHAQLTIRHPGGGSRVIMRPTTAVLTTTDTPRSKDGTIPGSREGNVHFECSWEKSGESVITEVIPIESGIQKFESWPQPVKISAVPKGAGNSPSVPVTSSSSRIILGKKKDSDSQQPSSTPPFSTSLKPRVIQPYGRRCKSTCSITLANNNISNTTSAVVSFENQCGSSEGSERASSLPPEKPILKDAETQTINRGNSATGSNKPVQPKMDQEMFVSTNTATGKRSGVGTNEALGDKLLTRRNVGVGGRIRKDIVVPAEVENRDIPKSKNSSPAERLSRKATRSFSPKFRAKSSPPVRHQQPKSNQPRTIHIDVYCTGSDVSTNTEDNSSSEDSTATPQTVFESPQYKISHHVKKKQIPVCFTSNVADLVNLATNQVKLNRKEKGRSASFGKVAGKIQSLQPGSVATSNVGCSKLKNPLTNDSNKVKEYTRKNLNYCDDTTATESLSTSYPSSGGISRNTTATSFSSDWTQVDLNDRRENDKILRRSWNESGDFLFSSTSGDSISIGRSTSYDYSDSLEGLEASPVRRNEDISHLPDSQNEQWWIDYIFKKFNSKERDVNVLMASPSDLSQTPEKESTNLIRMKRLSIPNANLLEGVSVDERLPPFMSTSSNSYDVDQGDTLLLTASKFGSVVKGFKKPGHHIVGPAKNPDCPCQHCRFHFESKECNWKGDTSAPGQNRARAFSLSHVDSLSNSSLGGCRKGIGDDQEMIRFGKLGCSRNYKVAVLLVSIANQAQSSLHESSQKIDLLKLALEQKCLEIRGDTRKSQELKLELESAHSVGKAPHPLSPTSYTSLQPFNNTGRGPLTPSHGSNRLTSALSKCAAVTGKLEVRLMGCQDLLDEVPGRSKSREATNSDLKSFVKGVTGRSSSKSYNIKDETSNEIMAVLKLDNQTVAQTNWKACSQQAWDQRFSIDLDKSRELEIDVYWRDYRSLCAVKFLRLEEFIDDVRHGMALQLEPQGLLFAEIKFLNPMISRKPKLQRQKKIFKQQGKNVPRPTQMNINVATWTRLIKRSTMPNQPQTPTTPTTPTAAPQFPSSANYQHPSTHILNNNPVPTTQSAPPRPPKLDLSQIPSKADVIAESNSQPTMVTFGGIKSATPSSAASIQKQPVFPVLVTTPSEIEVTHGCMVDLFWLVLSCAAMSHATLAYAKNAACTYCDDVGWGDPDLSLGKYAVV
ncbi:unnamed protein product [Allacma fusca]|uniref:C2 domain-containing protein n=1 Tax=Allacma fusca TaxID=39272 RepID=A0A8J2PXN3_9HEXA|nr:unnamed protein product [Allacma fusca]